MHCMLMDLLHGFEVLSTTEETLFNSRNVSRLVQNKTFLLCNLRLIFDPQLEVRCSECKSFGWLNVELGLIFERINLCKVSVARNHVDIS